MPRPLADIGDLLSPTERAEAVVLIATHDPEGDLNDDDQAALHVLLRPPSSFGAQERYLVAHQILRDLFRTPRYVSLYLIALLAPWLDADVRRLSDILSEAHHRWP